MTKDNDSSDKGPGTTQDPNQADLNDVDPWPDPHKKVPERPGGQEQKNRDPESGPGTTEDPNQADRT